MCANAGLKLEYGTTASKHEGRNFSREHDLFNFVASRCITRNGFELILSRENSWDVVV